MPAPKARSRWVDYGLLALLLAAAYWPLSSLHHAPRWDAMEGYFPFRFFLSDSIRQGILPLWNPYVLGGYPFYGDPQSGFWYPLAWVFGSLSPYNLSLFACAYLFHLLVAATGCYELLRTWSLGRVAACVAGFSFAAGGFFVGNAEHFTWVISAAWLPWVFWAYAHMQRSKAPGYALMLALFLYLLLSGGYPAFFIVTVYGLLCCSLLLLVSRLNRQGTRAWVGRHLLAAVVLLALSAGALLSWKQAMPFSTRSAGMSLAQINLYPFPPRALISLLLPFASLKDDLFFGTDVVMRNAYLGLLGLLALPLAWPELRRSRRVQGIALCTLLALAISFGDTLPLRGWLANLLPGMDRFRFPALFRVFFILGCLLIAAEGVEHLTENFKASRKMFLACILGLMAVFVGLWCYSVARHGLHWGWGFLAENFETYQHQSSRDDNLQFQALLQLFLLALLLWLCAWRGGRLFRPGLLLLFCAADMSLALSLNAFTTLVNEERAPNISARIAAAPHDFPVPSLSLPVAAHTDAGRKLGELRTNTGIYFQTPQADGYNSFYLKNFARLDASALADSVRANPVCYFASGMTPAPDSVPLPGRSVVRVSAAVAQAHTGVLLAQKGSLQIRHFLPGDILMHCTAPGTALLCLQQNFFPGWALEVDGHPAPIQQLNESQMGVFLAAGPHEVHWHFEPTGIRSLLYGTWALLLLLLSGMLLFRRRLFGQVTEG